MSKQPKEELVHVLTLRIRGNDEELEYGKKHVRQAMADWKRIRDELSKPRGTRGVLDFVDPDSPHVPLLTANGFEAHPDVHLSIDMNAVYGVAYYRDRRVLDTRIPHEE